MNNKLGIAILSVVIAIVTAMTTVLLGYAPCLHSKQEQPHSLVSGKALMK